MMDENTAVEPDTDELFVEMLYNRRWAVEQAIAVGSSHDIERMATRFLAFVENGEFPA